jgi:hypothetical protein
LKWRMIVEGGRDDHQDDDLFALIIISWSHHPLFPSINFFLWRKPTVPT